MKILFIVLLSLSLTFTSAYGSITLQNTNISLDNYNLNITTPITVHEIQIYGDGIVTRSTIEDELRKYNFDKTDSIDVYNVHWDSIDSSKTQFNITQVQSNNRGLVSGSLLDDIELNDVSVNWSYFAQNLVYVGNDNKVEYFFTPYPNTFNSIILSVNKNPFTFGHFPTSTLQPCTSAIEGGTVYDPDTKTLTICNGLDWVSLIPPPTTTTLGGVFEGNCDTTNNFTMSGVWANGTIRCWKLP